MGRIENERRREKRRRIENERRIKKRRRRGNENRRGKENGRRYEKRREKENRKRIEKRRENRKRIETERRRKKRRRIRKRRRNERWRRRRRGRANMTTQRKRTGMRTGIEAKVTMRPARRAKRKAANRQKVRSGQEVVVALRRKTPGTQVATAVVLRRKRGKARALIRASENKKARCPAVAAVLTRRIENGRR